MVDCRSTNPIDNMLKMLSDYTHHMEELVRQRENELLTEKKQVEDMLYNILPRFIHLPISDSTSSSSWQVSVVTVGALQSPCYFPVSHSKHSHRRLVAAS